ncbi:fasciclin domain-containing protein [uncultured Sulfitobacter sp.]|uniref:fasciclin domain-containing protein n=1 Tax=uncultured Sulfitobacter sp. TaxID=191468 RepID=UPI0026220204|nr:fasciclin domain-containing protein [uncultured Sulfitobacter sp.]
MSFFTFSGFEASDLFGPHGIFSHATFTMPAGATLEINVTDDDSHLSGDAHFNERGDDHTQQTATLLRDGVDVGTGGRLYAEQVWHVSGDDGKTYRLVELEQPGERPDSFTFLGEVPPAGVMLTVGGRVNVSGSGLEYADLSAGAAALPNIVDIAGGSDDFNILVKALSAAGLVETVQNLNDITVFAPTDAAFTQLATDLGFDGDTSDEDAVFGFIADALAGLAPDGDPIPLLTDILLYHVSAGAKTAAEVDAADAVSTFLEGATFGSEGTELIDNEPDIDNPNIVVPDVPASNGTIQGIDRVLLPLDIPGNTPLPNIVDIAGGSDDFNILVKALGAAGLVETVQNLNDITVFAPTDAAFTQLATDLGFDGDTSDEDAVFGFIADALAGLAPDGDPIPLLTDILLYHVSAGAKTAAEVDAADAVSTFLEGATFGSEGTELIDNEPDIDNPNIVVPDVPASNGTIQGIDRVLLPLDVPGNEPELPTLAGLVGASEGVFDKNGEDFDILLNAVQAAGLVGALDDPEADLTVFAPNDAAFKGLAATLGFQGHGEQAAFNYLVESLSLLSGGGDPIPLLTTVLTYHVAPEALDADAVLSSDGIATLQGGTLTVDGASLVDADPDVGNPNLIATNLFASNGVAHVLDGVLLPADLLVSDGSNGVDFKIGGEKRNVFFTGRDNDFVDGNGGDDVIILGIGNDVGVGGDGTDVIRGGRGEDLLVGGAGDDFLVGGRGADVFVFNTGDGNDVFLGFQTGIDKIDLSGTGFDSYDALAPMIMNEDGTATLDLGEDQSIVIDSRTLNLTEEDFIF